MNITEADGTTRRLIEAEGRRMELLGCDITRDGVPCRVVDTWVETLGSVDIQVNCAGTCRTAPPASSGTGGKTT